MEEEEEEEEEEVSEIQQTLDSTYQPGESLTETSQMG